MQPTIFSLFSLASSPTLRPLPVAPRHLAPLRFLSGFPFTFLPPVWVSACAWCALLGWLFVSTRAKQPTLPALVGPVRAKKTPIRPKRQFKQCPPSPQSQSWGWRGERVSHCEKNTHLRAPRVGNFINFEIWGGWGELWRA